MISWLKNLLNDRMLRKLFTGSGATLLFKLCGLLAGYIFTYYITQLLGRESYGIYALCFTILNIAVVVAKLGLDSALVKSIAFYHQNNDDDSALLYLRKSTWAVCFTSLVVGGVLFLLSGKLVSLFDNPMMEKGLKITALICIPNALLHIQAEKYRGLKKMWIYSLLINGTLTLLASAFLVFSFNRFGTDFSLSLWSLGLAITLFLLLTVLHRPFRHAKAIAWQRIPYKKIFTLSLPMLVSGSMFLIMGWTDVLLLGYFKTEEQVAVYSIAFKISAVITLVLYAINAIASPQFSELQAMNDPARLKRFAQNISKLNFMLTVPVVIGTILLSGIILNIFGAHYLEGQVALYILCAGQFFNAACGSVLTLLNMAGREKTVRNIVGLTALLNIVLNAVLIHYYGIEGAATATAISLVVWNIAGVVSVKKHYGFIMLPFVK